MLRAVPLGKLVDRRLQLRGELKVPPVFEQRVRRPSRLGENVRSEASRVVVLIRVLRLGLLVRLDEAGGLARRIEDDPW